MRFWQINKGSKRSGAVMERKAIPPNPYGKITRCDLWLQELNLINQIRTLGFGKMTLVFQNDLPAHAEMAVQTMKFDNLEPAPAK